MLYETEDLASLNKAIILLDGGRALKQRIISGIAIIIVILGMIWFGGAVTCVGMCLISLVAFYELASVTGVVEKEHKANSLIILGMASVIALYSLLFLCNWSVAGLVLVLLFILMLVCYVVEFPRYHASQLMNVIFSFFYGPFLLSYIYLTRDFDDGKIVAGKTVGFYLAWMIFISPWLSDTMAFFVGSKFGKHKIFPKLSPKKSVEGCIGGLFGGVIGGIAYYYLLRFMAIEIESMSVGFLAVIGLFGSLFGQIGDLVASAIKRNYGIKDYGKLIPGHGGIMDRFDSLLLIAPIMCFLCSYIG